ncbi:hypothetical protein PMIN07_008165 [Paraphaeosphaeria minitans]|uniref:Fungal specific transcription factor n=1 Tax=Paraphaeosphaeria minitans TaxID=565426 RepID=A0A9P6KUT0_9PLEO|nr:fungal specific transcription factor [Paraphaeosphaeria minitans]
MYSNKRPRLSPESMTEAPHPTSVNANAPRPRLTRACAECKALKSKCYTAPGQTSCTKCLKRKVHCEPYNFAQKFMDGDAKWKSHTAATVQNLQEAVELLLSHSRLPPLDKPKRPERSDSTQHIEHERRTEVLPIQSLHDVSPAAVSTVGPSQGSFTAEGPYAGMHLQDDDSDLVPLPMNNLYNLTDPTKSSLIRVDPSDVNGPDLIDQGVLPLVEAEYLYDFYRDHINPFFWTVVLTVAALHIPSREATLHATYGAFVSLMRRSCLLRRQNLDIVRALCIGAFYLTSLSWALCSRAVRVATEMNLHKSSLQFARSSHHNSYERVRLWYVLYVCDHQFALAYGRPPLMHEDAAIRNAEKLLTSELSSKGDKGLVAQVKLFRVLASIWLMYGCDPDLELSGSDFEKLQSFNLALDTWRLDHQGSEGGGVRENVALPRGNMLYYHLARFQLNSVALRGISGREESSDSPGLRTNWERQEAANNAIVAAMSTARLIVDDSTLQNGLIGLPIFVHAMVAVCASFLLKMAVVFAQTDTSSSSSPLRLPHDLVQYGLAFHTKMALGAVRQLVAVLVRVADNASQGHVARQVVNGLKELLQRFEEAPGQRGFVYSQPQPGMRDSEQQTAGNGQVCAGNALGVPNPSMERLGSGGAGVEGAGEVSLALQDPFDLTGDLDWRFDGSFLWGIDGMDITGGFA